jgi:hypothetical protein
MSYVHVSIARISDRRGSVRSGRGLSAFLLVAYPKYWADSLLLSDIS